MPRESPHQSCRNKPGAAPQQGALRWAGGRTTKCQHQAAKLGHFAEATAYCAFTGNQAAQSPPRSVGDTSTSGTEVHRQNLRLLKLSYRDCKSFIAAFHYREREKPTVFCGGQTCNQANSVKRINRTKWKWTSCLRVSGNSLFHNGLIWGINESSH